MSWLDEVRKRDQLLAWTEQGLLTPDQMERALAPEYPWPASRHWRQVLDRLLVCAGTLLLALGAIFFFAFNWDELHRMHKLVLALAVLSGFAGAGLFLPRGSVAYRACLCGAALATGGLLALVGQIYQTGADIWQLFASWSLLILPWALLSRSAACWGLFWLVLNLALLRYFAVHQSGLGLSLVGVQGLFAVALGNLALLVLFELLGSRLLVHPGRSLPRLALFALLGAVGLGASLGWWLGEYRGFLVALGLVYLMAIPCYLELRRDLLMLALLVYSLVGVGGAGLASWLDGRAGTFLLLSLLGLFVLLASAVASLWLQRLYREHKA